MTSPGTIALIGNKTDYRTCLPDGQQAILSLESLSIAVPPPSVLFGVVTEDPAQWEAVRMAASSQKPKVRPVFIADGPGQFPQDVLATAPHWSLILKEAYAYAGESIDAATVRWDREMADLMLRWKYDVGVVLQAYLMNGVWTVPQVQQIAANGVRLCNNYARIKAAVCFAWQRADGATGHPELAALQTQICAGSPGWPAFEPIPPIPPVPSKPSIIALC